MSGRGHWNPLGINTCATGGFWPLASAGQWETESAVTLPPWPGGPGPRLYTAPGVAHCSAGLG